MLCVVLLGVSAVFRAVEESAVRLQDSLNPSAKDVDKVCTGSFKIHIAQGESVFDAGQGL